MKGHPNPFRRGRNVLIDGVMHVVSHLDAGANRVQLKNISDGSITNERLHRLMGNLADSGIRVFDEIGVELDFSDQSSDISKLSEDKRKAFYLRVTFVKALDPLGRVGPDTEIFKKAVDLLCKKNEASIRYSTAYKWLQLYRSTGEWRSLASPGATVDGGRSLPRMHPTVQEAVSQVLAQEEAELAERIRAQKGKFAIRGRSGLSIKAITLRARAKVMQLHSETHVRLNESRRGQGLDELPLPELPAGPSNRTMQRLIYSTQSRWRMVSAIYGPHAATRALGPHGTNFRLARICERWEVDMFIVDLIVAVYYQGVLVPIGVPYLLAMIDCYSGVVVGLTIEFSTPNSKSFLALIKQSLQPKNWLFERFPGIKNPFPAFGIPEVIGFDNAGMFSTEEVRAAEASLNIALDPASPYSPNDKPFIESFGSSLKRKLIRYQPSNRPSIAESRAFEYEAQKQPPMPVDEFVRRVWEWVWNVHHEYPMEDRHGWSRRQTFLHSLQMLSEEEDPRAVFPFDNERIDLEVSARHELRYTDEGFTIRNRHFRSEEMHAIAMKFAKTFRFDVREDLCNAGQVFVNLPDLGRVVQISAVSEIPEFLTANGFDSLVERKRLMVESDSLQLAQALEESQKGWKPPRGTQHIPSTKEGLAAIVKRYATSATSNPLPLAGNEVPPPSPEHGMQDAFREHFHGGNKDA